MAEAEEEIAEAMADQAVGEATGDAPVNADEVVDRAMGDATGDTTGDTTVDADEVVDRAVGEATGDADKLVDSAVAEATGDGPVDADEIVDAAVGEATGDGPVDADEIVDAAVGEATGDADKLVESAVAEATGEAGDAAAGTVVEGVVAAALGEPQGAPGESEAVTVAKGLEDKLIEAATVTSAEMIAREIGEMLLEAVAPQAADTLEVIKAEVEKEEIVDISRKETLRVDSHKHVVLDEKKEVPEKVVEKIIKTVVEGDVEKETHTAFRQPAYGGPGWRYDPLTQEYIMDLLERRDMKKEKRPAYKPPMGGITQVPWTPTKRRGPIAAEYQSPGPACVALPNLTGGGCGPDSKKNRAPAFSFGSRPGGKMESPGPGPGQYNITGLSAKGRDNPPASSLHSRPKDLKASQTPAPGDYNPEKSDKIVHASPKFTFGLKTQPGKLSTTPAPNVYNIPTVLGATKEGNKKQAPAFTISGRQKDKPDDRVHNPGPGSYNDANADNYKTKSPAYSISSRYQMPGDASPKPGPGAHSPEKVLISLRWAPNYSFGIKHSPYKGDRGFKLVQDTSKSRCTCPC